MRLSATTMSAPHRHRCPTWRSSAICNLPPEVLRSILLTAVNHRLDRSYYVLATVSRSFHRVLADDSGQARHPPRELGPRSPSSARPPPSLLDFAVHNGFLDLARLLLESGADPNRHDPFTGYDDCASPVWAALSRDNIAMLRLLVEFGAVNPDSFGETGHAAARSAAAHRLLLEASEDPDGPTMVLQAGFARGDVGTVRLALAVEVGGRGLAEILATTTLRRAPDVATNARLIECAKMVLDAGADATEMLVRIRELEHKKCFSVGPLKELKENLMSAMR
ncbi:hypothetical protein DFJ73DRAFT_838665 [Zopfochytrium polystomum]|nr:hypothetical protein DFJ73DRAFT_838665 [Zopfochytrium polystomum]